MRDKLVGVMYRHLLDNHGNCNVNLLYGYEAEAEDFRDRGIVVGR